MPRLWTGEDMRVTYDPNASTEALPIDWDEIQKMQDQCTHPDGFQEDRMYSGNEIIAKRWICKICKKVNYELRSDFRGPGRIG